MAKKTWVFHFARASGRNTETIELKFAPGVNLLMSFKSDRNFHDNQFRNSLDISKNVAITRGF